MQCPSCENKYSRKDYLENHIRKAHEEKDLNSGSNSSFDTESNEKEVTAKKSNEKTCIPCEKTFYTSRDLKRHGIVLFQFTYTVHIIKFGASA